MLIIQDIEKDSIEEFHLPESMVHPNITRVLLLGYPQEEHIWVGLWAPSRSYGLDHLDQGKMYHEEDFRSTNIAKILLE